MDLRFIAGIRAYQCKLSLLIDVAVGVVSDAQGRVLLASRPAGKPYAGWWEFPGGKVEAGETVAQALARELHEELALDIEDARPWVTREHQYEHAHVRLHFTRVTRWRGEAQAREQQQFGWFFINDQNLPTPALPATLPVLRWLRLPEIIGISQAKELGQDIFIAALEQAFAQGLRGLIIREPGWNDAHVNSLLDAVLPLARRADARVLVSSRHDAALWQRAGGVHFTSADLKACIKRPALEWVSASVHQREEIAHAAQLGVDFCLLGHISPTASHIGLPPMDWAGFKYHAQHCELPVFALGGLTVAHLAVAQSHGAHGIALMRSLWSW